MPVFCIVIIVVVVHLLVLGGARGIFGQQWLRFLRNWQRIYWPMLTNAVIETLLRVIAWRIQLCAVFGLPAILICLSMQVRAKVARFIRSAAIVIATFLCLNYVFENPAIEIPEEYMQYIDESDINMIRGRTKGIYSNNIPVIGISAHVDFADEYMIDFSIHYWPYGHQTVNIGDVISLSDIF